MSFWDTPEGQRALQARNEDRRALYEAMRQSSSTWPCPTCGKAITWGEREDHIKWHEWHRR